MVKSGRDYGIQMYLNNQKIWSGVTFLESPILITLSKIAANPSALFFFNISLITNEILCLPSRIEYKLHKGLDFVLFLPAILASQLLVQCLALSKRVDSVKENTKILSICINDFKIRYLQFFSDHYCSYKYMWYAWIFRPNLSDRNPLVFTLASHLDKFYFF